MMRISGLLAACDHIQSHITTLAQAPSAEEAEQLTERMLKLVAQVDALCARHGSNPANLPTSSRRAYQWLRFLAEEGSLADHLGTVALGYELFRENARVQEQVRLGHSVQFELVHTGHLWRISTKRNVLHLAAAEGFCRAPREVLLALIQAATLHSTRARAIVSAYATSVDFTEIATALELMTEPAENSTPGQHYDLDAVFARVNHHHFGGAMPRPRRLIWSNRITTRVMGYYQARSDTVMLSKTLDDASVPERVIDLVMYHELLHKQLGSRMSNGRRQVHFSAFREAERRFPNFDAVNAELQLLTQRAAPKAFVEK
jgi:hypothetical protein